MAQVLLVGANRKDVAGLRGLLREDGHQVTRLHSVDQWRDCERESLPELVMATAECADAIVNARGTKVRGFPPPLLFVQHETGFAPELFMDERLVDHIATPFMSEELLARVDALIRVRRVVQRVPQPDGPRKQAADEPPHGGGGRKLLGQLSALLNSRIPRYQKPVGPYLEVAARLAEWADRRDAFEPGHAERVTSFCAMIADGLGLGTHETSSLLRAAMLHDIGKVALPVEILHQKEPLQESQRRLIRTHPQRGAALLRALDPDDEVAETILYHHECPNGSGYYGKRTDDTPRTASILAVAEVYDAMTSCRVTEPLSREQAIEALEGRKGVSLDGACVDALVDTLKPRPHVIPLSNIPRRPRF